MAEEKVEPAEEKPKKPLVKIIVVAVIVVTVLLAAVFGTLFATGFFSKKAHVDPEAVLEESEAGEGHGAKEGGHGKADSKEEHKGGHGGAKEESKGGHGGGDKKDKTDQPQRKPIPADKDTRFEKSYMDLDDKKPLISNVAGSRKVMQVSLSLMTQYDERVFKNVEKHRTALRSACLDVLRQVTEADLSKPEFRSELLARLRERINSELERLEGFGGIEEVFFAEFVFQ